MSDIDNLFRDPDVTNVLAGLDKASDVVQHSDLLRELDLVARHPSIDNMSML